VIPESQAAFRNASTRLSHSPIWFQLANVRVTALGGRNAFTLTEMAPLSQAPPN